MLPATLTPEEIAGLTTYVRASKQVADLRARGFALAAVVRGRTSVPREHYNAVCRGIYGKTESAYDEPRLKSERERA
jgi:hypothetical protein